MSESEETSRPHPVFVAAPESSVQAPKGSAADRFALYPQLSDDSLSDDDEDEDDEGLINLAAGNQAPLTCTCKKSRCLKKYCSCFSSGKLCVKDCECKDCMNDGKHERQRLAARKTYLKRNPAAFTSKFTDSQSHIKGCNCRKSNCLKRYCECFQAGTTCGDQCNCVDCENVPRSRAGSGESMLSTRRDVPDRAPGTRPRSSSDVTLNNRANRRRSAPSSSRLRQSQKAMVDDFEREEPAWAKMASANSSHSMGTRRSRGLSLDEGKGTQ